MAFGTNFYVGELGGLPVTSIGHLNVVLVDASDVESYGFSPLSFSVREYCMHYV